VKLLSLSLSFLCSYKRALIVITNIDSRSISSRALYIIDPCLNPTKAEPYLNPAEADTCLASSRRRAIKSAYI
jgi:hypothetical protein